MVYNFQNEWSDFRKSILVQETGEIMRPQRNDKGTKKSNTCAACPLMGVGPISLEGNTDNPPLLVIFDVVPIGLGATRSLSASPLVVRFKQSLLASGIDPNKCCYTSLVKCPTPIVRGVQRPPTAAEISNCFGRLETEIKSVNPRFILGLGDTVLKKFMGSGYNLSKSEGIPLKYSDSITFIGTFSLMQAMEVPEKHLQFRDTCQRIAKWLSSSMDPGNLWVNPGIIYLYREDEVLTQLKWLSEQPEWSCDIETDNVKLDAKLYSISFSNGETTLALPIRKPNGDLFWSSDKFYTSLLSMLRDLFSNAARKIFHFSTFDALILKQNGLSVKNLADTFLLYYLIDENAKNTKLKYLIWKVLGIGGYEAEYDTLTENRSAAGVPTDILLKYNANDAYATKLLWDALIKKVDHSTLKLLNVIVLPFQEVLITAMHRGLRIDREYAQKMISKYSTDLDVLTAKMYQVVGHKFDILSTKDLQKVLFKELKLKCVKRTAKTNSPAVDEEALEALRGEHEIIDLLLEHRKISKLLSTYFEPMLEKCDENGVLHPTFIIGGTRTGRLSSKNPNCQNIPRGSEVKNLFIARPDYVLIDIDFKQIEFRMAGHLAHDQKMRDDIINGLDIHTEVASRVFQVPYDKVTKTQRTQAKGAVFGILFGRGPKSLAKEYGMSEQEATNLINTFLSMYPRVNVWIQTTKALVKRYGFLRNEFGRIRHFPGIWSNNKELVSKTERQAVNFLPQSTAADYTFFRAVRLAKILEPLDTYLVLTVHDSLIYEAPKKNIHKVLEEIFTELNKQLDFIFIPIEFELSVGYKLGSTYPISSPEDLEKFLKGDTHESQ